jgi:hypothetical protein
MATKKDGDKGKKTLSGKKPSTFGGSNSKLLKTKPTEKSMMFSKGPAPKMGKDATGERNFDRTSSSRATVSVGPATLNMGGKTAKSKGGMNMTGGKVMPKKQSNPTAKVSGSGNSNSNAKPGWETAIESQQIALDQKASGKRSARLAIGIGAGVLGTGITIAGGGKKLKQAAKYIGDTKERKARKRAQKAENDAMIIERKAKAEAKNPSTPVGKNSKISKRTRNNMNRLKKQ